MCASIGRKFPSMDGIIARTSDGERWTLTDSEQGATPTQIIFVPAD